MLVYGVVHLQSLPGSPSNRISLDEIIDLAQEDVNNLIFGGVDGIIIENFGDTPFVKDDISKRTLASFTTVVENLSIEKDIKVGINVLRNDGIAALSIISFAHVNQPNLSFGLIRKVHKSELTSFLGYFLQSQFFSSLDSSKIFLSGIFG